MKLTQIIQAPHRIVSQYGIRVHPITKVKTFHNGIDIAKPTGTAITAHADGVVSQIYVHATGGLTMIFDGNDKIQLRMCHLHTVLKKQGDKVKAGEVIATVGGDPKDRPNAGRSTGSHLHLGIVNKGVRVHPLTVFSL